ncbi:glycerol dehydratase, cobalamin-independent, large subunit [Acetitomaculum ruminis DSM 5522]|uniref:Glycerol dehydratase, cobalamin-independent, large subunit n=1 Tax=Acetitomaculum ruminis DSM 5522 TaxID=1120918 RepID=A0A1I0W294_9FIRM|nr:pyruvate formate lyase family protein [Acetitomaculum ruminis]SFA82223.1 glycerol dehydratase, cobalamin-independent, large subunit [Acetitomaculum ruminis DSM 5522]
MIKEVAISPRVARVREKFRSTRPQLDIARYKLVTEFYMENPNITGILKRAYNLKNLFENMPTPVFDDEVIVGYPANTYRGCVIFPENSFSYFYTDNPTIDNIRNRSVDPMDIDEDDYKYLMDTAHFWDKNSMSAIVDQYLPESYKKLAGAGVLNFRPSGNCGSPIGHFIGNFWTVCDKGFGAIVKEAKEKMEILEEKGIQGDEARHYIFYRAVVIVSEGLITYTKRYAKECKRLADECKDEKRKEELLSMAESLEWIIENPCRTYRESLQACYLYQMGHILDAQLHGISYGRLDQYCGKYLEKDLKEGRITEDEAQEITDLFMLKVAEINRLWSEAATHSGPGYTTGQLVTIGGTDKDGNDATNLVTYMILRSSRRLKIHQPPVAIRIHDNTPDELWEEAIATNSAVGGVPSFEYDNVIVKSMVEQRGISLEDARNYALVGCVEPAVCGCDFANSGGDGNAAYTILPAALWLAINNGVNPFRFPGAPEPTVSGPQTGYLYEMKSMGEVLKAYKTQMDYFTKWQVNMVNCYEYIYSFHTPLPLLSATMTGCMESGLDVLWGGAKYNGAGNSSIGHGTVADSLNIINQICFVEKKATTRELYDALIANWEGYEDLHQYILGKAKHFGNNDPEADQFISFVADTYADGIKRGVSPRGCNWSAGCWPVTLNVVMGMFNHATPDGRYTGQPLSDGISPVQAMDKNGPFSTINSILKFDESKYPNGTLCNMKFHPTVLQGADGYKKLRAVMEAFFKGGGMELQLNIVSADTLRDAQEHPENYKDLVVRIAGFSAYFVEVFKESQDDLIRRTEMSI